MEQLITQQRRAGVILHPTSLPGPGSHGTLGKQAYYWVDWLQRAGFTIWQCLPLTPVIDGSPYNSYSAFAGNSNLIDLEQLETLGFPATETQPNTLQSLHKWFQSQPNHPLQQELQQFIASEHWLEDYCLYATLRHQSQTVWTQWPQPLRDRDPDALAEYKGRYIDQFSFHQFCQFLFTHQWNALKAYANERSIAIFGDIPIFVSQDSADVWTHRELFKLNEDGTARVVAGVPPDYFSATGQRWGNPLYEWEQHKKTGFGWWCDRINSSLDRYDAVRIDHFRGLEACWEIPRDEPDAVHGQWVQAPGDELLSAALNHRQELPLIAEDLGIITDEVTALRKKFAMPGMAILQFAFDSDNLNPYLPHNHTADLTVYTGTHDNNTTMGWYNHLDEAVKQKMSQYLASPAEPMPWPLIKCAFASPANWAIVPLQDLLELDESHRMNTPGTIENNWQWRFEWEQFSDDLADRIREMLSLYNR